MSFAANTANVVAEIFKSPTQNSSVVLAAPAAPPTAAPAPAAAPVPVTSHFKLVFLGILVFTILAGAAEIALAIRFPDPPQNLQAAFAAMDFVWKAGAGAIFGLIGGKVA